MAVRLAHSQTLAVWRAAVCAHHVGFGPGLVDEHQSPGSSLGWLSSQSCRRAVTDHFGTLSGVGVDL